MFFHEVFPNPKRVRYTECGVGTIQWLPILPRIHFPSELPSQCSLLPPLWALPWPRGRGVYPWGSVKNTLVWWVHEWMKRSHLEITPQMATEPVTLNVTERTCKRRGTKHLYLEMSYIWYRKKVKGVSSVPENNWKEGPGMWWSVLWENWEGWNCQKV